MYRINYEGVQLLRELDITCPDDITNILKEPETLIKL